MLFTYVERAEQHTQAAASTRQWSGTHSVVTQYKFTELGITVGNAGSWFKLIMNYCRYYSWNVLQAEHRVRHVIAGIHTAPTNTYDFSHGFLVCFIIVDFWVIINQKISQLVRLHVHVSSYGQFNLYTCKLNANSLQM